MALPLPEPAGPGGDIVASMRAQNALTESNLKNMYYGPNIQSEIGYRNALAQGQNIHNQYLPEEYSLANQSAAENLAQLKKTNPIAYQQLIQNNALLNQKTRIMQQIANGNPDIFAKQTSSNNQAFPAVGSIPQGSAFSPIPQNQPANNLAPNGSLAYTPIQQNNSPGLSQGTPPPQQAQMQQQPGKSNLTYPQIAMGHQIMGWKQPEIIDVNGSKYAVSPFGNVPVAQGMTPKEEAYEKGLGTYSSKAYGEAVDTATGLQNQQVALDQLVNLATTDPEFRNVTGPIGNFLTTWAGNAGQQELLGQLQSSSGEISLAVAPSLKGAFTGRDQTLLNSIKAGPKDFADVFLGKLKAQSLINKVLQERAWLRAKYIDQKMKPHEAGLRAARETPLDKYRPEVEKLIRGNEDKMISISRINDYTKKKETIKTTLGEARRKYGIRQ